MRNTVRKILVDQINQVPILLHHSSQSIPEHVTTPFLESLSRFTYGILDYRKAHFLDEEIQTMRQFSSEYPNSTFHLMSAIFQLLYRGQTKIVDHKYDFQIDLNKAKELIIDETLQQRDALLLEALLQLTQQNTKQSCFIHQQIANLYPKDLINAFLAYNSYIVLYEMEPIEELIEQKMLPHFTAQDHQRAYLDAMLCFVKEQKGLFDLAMQYGNSALLQGSQLLETSIQYEFLHPWTHHSLCHVYHQSAKLVEGIQFMNQVQHYWKECNFFMQHHNYWHLCLLFVESMQLETALSIYETHIWKSKMQEEEIESWRNDNTVLAGALGILIRLELTLQLCEKKLNKEMIPLLQQWLQYNWLQVKPIVLSKWEKPETMLPNLFLSIHIFYALMHFDPSISLHQLVQPVQEFLQQNSIPNYLIPIYQNALLTLIKTQYYYLHGEFAKGLLEMERNEKEFFEQQHHFGGSNEQREIIDLLFYNLLIKENQKEKIAMIVKQRLAITKHRPFLTLDALKEVYNTIDLSNKVE